MLQSRSEVRSLHSVLVSPVSWTSSSLTQLHLKLHSGTEVLSLKFMTMAEKLLHPHFRMLPARVGRDGSLVKDTYCSCRRPGIHVEVEELCVYDNL